MHSVGRGAFAVRRRLETEDSMSVSQEKIVCVIGPKKTANELMASYLEPKLHLPCRAGEDGFRLPLKDELPALALRLILWDCRGQEKDSCLVEFESHYPSEREKDLVAFFNARPLADVEEEAIARGVRGFFYEKDDLDILPRGIRAIFDGEFWVSRQILAKCVFRDRPTANRIPQKTRLLLTQREVEILSLICIGTGNGEIADQLSISRHTVKTHIYNIFKKIGVPNRLQAALWAGKNL
jgi:LuxR family transcriptional regulator of csgAB operon